MSASDLPLLLRSSVAEELALRRLDVALTTVAADGFAQRAAALGVESEAHGAAAVAVGVKDSVSENGPGTASAGSTARWPWRRLTWILLGIGVVLRLARYVACPSLWFDEAALAVNVLDRDFAGLLLPLDDAQVAPVGYTALLKVLVLVLGNGELVFRLPSLLAGLASLFLVFGVARACLRPSAVPMAVGLGAVCEPLVRYSSEVKQYSCDAAIALLLCLVGVRVAARLDDGRLGARGAVALGALGGACMWFSQAALFVLAGVGTVLWIGALRRGDRVQVARLSIVGAIWLASFVALYAVCLHDALENSFLEEFWGGSAEPGSPKGGAFMPLLPLSPGELSWFGRAFFGLFEDVLGFSLVGVAAVVFAVGAVAMARERARAAALLLAPLAICLLVSGLHLYPFYGRLLLFAAPALLLVMAEGAAAVGGARGQPAFLAFALLFLLFADPAVQAVRNVARPAPTWDARAAISYVQEHRRPGDVLYVYYSGHTQMRYYAARFGIDAQDYSLGVCSRDDWSRYEEEIDELAASGRAWVLFSHWLRDEKAFFIARLDRMGTRADSFKSGHAEVYLYDFR
jgi:hypothetical protein